jgi:hypothetical protein
LARFMRGNLRITKRRKKLIAAWEFYADPGRAEYCKTCRETKDKPPCDSCEWGTPPEIEEANLETWELWQEVKTQWRAGGAGIIGLDYKAVYQEADRLEIDLSPGTFSKIKALESFTLKMVHKC